MMIKTAKTIWKSNTEEKIFYGYISDRPVGIVFFEKDGEHWSAYSRQLLISSETRFLTREDAQLWIEMSVEEFVNDVCGMTRPPDVNPHECPKCNWQCGCDKSPCEHNCEG